MASARYDIVKNNYIKGTWSLSNVELAAEKAWITKEELEEIKKLKEIADAESAERRARIMEAKSM